MRALVVLVWLVACDAGERPAAPAQPPPKPAPIDEPRMELSYLPGDVDGVMHIDVVALRAAKLWAQHGTTFSRVLLPGFDHCGYDAMAKLTAIDVGFTGAGTSYVVFRGLDRVEAMRCFKTAKPGTISIDGEVMTLTRPNRRTHLATFADARTMVMVGADQPSKDVLLQALQGGSPLAKNRELLAAVQGVARAGAAMWLVSRPDSKEFEKAFGGANVGIASMQATLRVTDRLDIHIVMTTKTSDAATALATLLDTQQQTLKTLFDRLDARAQDHTVTYDMGMTGAQLESMMGMMGSMLGA